MCPLAGKVGLAMPQNRAAGEGAVTGRVVWGCAWGLRAWQGMAEGASRAYGGTFSGGTSVPGCVGKAAVPTGKKEGPPETGRPWDGGALKR